MFMIEINEIAEAFKKRYAGNARIFQAPGRVNLIGEHTDYNDGFVLPMAINQGTVVAIAARPDRVIRAWSINLDDSIELNLDQLGSGRHGSWLDYMEGIAAALLAKGMTLTGADIVLKSDISIGGGLSSSAALEMSLGTALAAVSNCSIDGLSLAIAGQTAEHLHVGIHCGIMDQFTSVFGVKNHAILLDCRSLEAKTIPINLNEYQLVICDSLVKHTLASSEYNRRRNDCELAIRQLSQILSGIRSLRDVTLSDLEAHQSLLSPEVFRRCRHVVSENARTLKAAEALAAGDAKEMGRLMSASHQSLQNDYEVSCRELDLLVASALTQPGVLGARMTGGGFGGCTVNLVEKKTIDSFKENVTKAYQSKTQICPHIFVAEASDGACEIVV
jgi:galactokinase